MEHIYQVVYLYVTAKSWSCKIVRSLKRTINIVYTTTFSLVMKLLWFYSKQNLLLLNYSSNWIFCKLMCDWKLYTLSYRLMFPYLWISPYVLPNSWCLIYLLFPVKVSKWFNVHYIVLKLQQRTSVNIFINVFALLIFTAFQV